MTVPPSIRAVARSAYRDLLRASASTFAGMLLQFSYLHYRLNVFLGDAAIQKGRLPARPTFVTLTSLKPSGSKCAQIRWLWIA